jgi:cytoskeletal protein CcmA (bactofilin family)
VFNRILSQKPQASDSSTKPTDEEAAILFGEKPIILTPTTSKPTMADISTHSSKNVLAADVEIKGSIKFQNDLIVDGKVEGEITSSGVLTVGENAEIRGEIKTKSATVFGKVHGNITVEERCELKSRAVLQGDLKAARLVIEEGATFVGKSEVTPNKGAIRAPEASSRPVEAPKAAAVAGR